MSTNDIIQMAREAGAIPIHKDYKQNALVGNENIERFAQMVAADAITKEREACAKVCEELHDTFYDQDNSGRCAEAIRARGQQ